MAKIIFKMSVMFVCLGISFISIAGCDSISVSYGFIVTFALVILPLLLLAVLCNKGWFNDLLEWTEEFERSLIDK